MTDRKGGAWRLASLLSALLFLPGLAAGHGMDPRTPPGSWQQYAQSEQAGWSARLLAKARLDAEALGTTAVMAVYRGRVLAAWGDVTRRCQVHSLRKSILNALIGIAAENDRIDIDRTIADLQIDDLQELTPDEKQATVRDLLRGRSGIYHPAAKETAEMKKQRPARGSHHPGEFWFYNNWDFNVLGSILERETQNAVGSEFGRLIAAPVGMQDFRPRDFFNHYERNLTRYPAYTFHLSARDLARFGQLYLQLGEWNGQRIVPADWIWESWTPYSEIKPNTFYGYMWWIYPYSPEAQRSPFPALRTHDRFVAWGSSGQMVLVIPGDEFVFVHLADTDTGAAVDGNKIWRLAEAVLAARTGPAAEAPVMGPLSPIPFKNAVKPAPEFREVSVDAAIKSGYCGTYRLDGKRLVQFRLYGQQLAGGIVTGNGGIVTGDGGIVTEMDFFPSSANFFFSRIDNVQVIFNPGKKGRNHSLTWIYHGKLQKAKRIL